LLAACGQQTPAPATQTVVDKAAPPTAAPPKPTAAAAAPTTAPAPAAAPTVAPAAPTTAPKPAAAATGKDSPVIQQLYEAAKKEGKVVWWDQHAQDVAEQYIVEFKKLFPGIDVEYFEATQDVLLTRTVAEARAGRVAYDVQDSGQNYPSYKELGLITDNTQIFQIAGADPSNIVEGTCNPEWNVYGCSYNTDVIKESELPRNWAGWLEPKWKGQIAIETRLRPFVYGTPFMGGEEKVTEYLSKLKANDPIHTSGDTKSQTLVAAGEYPVLIGAYLQRLVNMKGKPWGFVPLEEVYSNAPGPGYSVPEKAAHPNAGRVFLYFLNSPEGVALIDRLRFKGNPLPGTGTGPSKFLEERKMTLKVAPPEIELEYSKFERKYAAALGLPVT
jgi:iron(III) transport system substrate-binding protein